MVNDTYYIQVPLLKNEKDRLRVHLIYNSIGNTYPYLCDTDNINIKIS